MKTITTMLNGILIFLGCLQLLGMMGLYQPSITISPAMAQAIASDVQAEWNNQNAIIAELNAPARKAKNKQ